MSLTFPSGVEGITYHVETSTNLRDWTIERVEIADPRPDGMRMAGVLRCGARRCLRLAIGQ